MTDSTQANDPSEYHGEHGYWYNDEWHRDIDSALEAWWSSHVDYLSQGETVTSGELLKTLAPDTFRRGKPVEIDVRTYAIHALERMEEDHYRGVEDLDHLDEVPFDGPDFDALVVALKACASHLSDVYTEGEPVNLTPSIERFLSTVGEDEGLAPEDTVPNLSVDSVSSVVDTELNP